jgi:hypothetical protein
MHYEDIRYENEVHSFMYPIEILAFYDSSTCIKSIKQK